MTFFIAVFLAVIQGVTEFLPVSSSGHLVLFQKLFQISSPPVLFDVLLHLGTLVAIVFFLRKEIMLLIKEWRKRKNEWLFLIIGTFPAAIFGFFLNSKIDAIFNSLALVGFMWILFGTLLLSTHFLIDKKALQRKSTSVDGKDGLIIGLFQALALFPGISRSGSTIIGSMFRKFSRENAFTLSFLLSIPAVLGATVLKLKDGNLDGLGLETGLISIIVAGVVGFFSLKLLKKVLNSDKFYLFGFYCLILGFTVVLINGL